MKKFLLSLIFVLIFTTANCFAMELTQSIKLGSISTLPPWGVFNIEGATSNQGTLSKEAEYNSGRDYAKGVACFGSGEGALYVHYDNSYVYSEDFKLEAFHSKELAKSCRMGDKNIEYTLILPLSFPHTCAIYQITNDAGLNLYLLEYDKSAVPSYKLIGKRQDGKWVRYFETVAAEQYYGMIRAFCHNFKLDGDKIIFEYGRFDVVDKKFKTNIELQFIWNDADQWFGVEMINCNYD